MLKQLIYLPVGEFCEMKIVIFIQKIEKKLLDMSNLVIN